MQVNKLEALQFINRRVKQKLENTTNNQIHRLLLVNTLHGVIFPLKDVKIVNFSIVDE